MRLCTVSAIISAAALTCSPAFAATQVELNISSFSYSDAFTVKGLFDELSGPLSHGEDAFSFNQAEIAFSRESWQVAVFERRDYLAQFTPDTARLFYQGQNKLPADANAQYDIYLRLRQIRSSGIGIAYTFTPSDNSIFRPRLNILKASDFTDGTLSGSVTTSNTGTYSGTASLNYIYGEDHLLDRNVDKPSDYGASIDLYGEWESSDKVTITAEVRDLFGRIRWSQAPITNATANTNNANFDSDGFLDVRPAVSGAEGFRKYTQKIPTRYRLNTSYQWEPNITLAGEIFHVEGITFPRLQIVSNLGAVDLSWTADFKAKALGITYQGELCSAGIMSDSLSFNNAQTLSLQFGCNLMMIF